MFVISIDLGYRYVKAVNSRYERVMFPSFVSLAETQGLDRCLVLREQVEALI